MQSLPTPAESPSLEPKDTSHSSGSRKRQRTESMQSDTSSSSAKRSLSDGPALDFANNPDESDATITDIDAYMAEQGEADIPETIQLTGAKSVSVEEDTQKSMPPALKLVTVKQLRDKHTSMEIGETWYITARSWYRRWEKACSGMVDKEGGIGEGELADVYKEELNPENPLGMHGAIAEAFGALLHRIWAQDSTSTSYSPREFKQQLQRFAPQFSGYQQHDSQELVAFLLDGLHEDLNRVKKKPYVEKPDWEGGGDREMVALAKRSWDGYMLRNDSVIVDLFQGQYQSTLVCPECQKVSITFDPFMYLTLPLPMHKKWRHEIQYIPWDPAKPHLKIPVEISVDASFRDLRQLLGRWQGVSPDNHLPFDGPITEIKENGDVVTVQDEAPEEGDIVDEKNLVIREVDLEMDTVADGPPKVTGTKKDIFQIRLQKDFKDYGAGYLQSSARPEPWDDRLDELDDEHPILLRDGDAFFCDFDENMKAYYFGEDTGAGKWEHARWTVWEPFVHPEYTEAKKANSERKSKGMSLEDCLAEFTKEEQLGDDDLWYCPQCKKHQHATKKFDLWKAPDVLVVHLKRFSNNRTMRDKIDTLVEFPVKGLDIGYMVGERLIAEKLIAAGADPQSLHLGDLDEPLVYDLFAVDEHMGGLGGGHYRAYAMNHTTEQWYHFDDSYVTKARAEDAINANAYLLFYKRRSHHPLGGKTHTKIEEARLKQPSASSSNATEAETQLATPPDEPASIYGPASEYSFGPSPPRTMPTGDSWLVSHSNSRSSPASSPPPLDDTDIDLPSFDNVNMLSQPFKARASGTNFQFPDPTSKGSPSSSIEAEPDLDELTSRTDEDMDWGSPAEQDSDCTGSSEGEPVGISREPDPAPAYLDNGPTTALDIQQHNLDGHIAP
ncbi:hypothetical protein HWV62_26194 [Athelia sp. TMB]|nr:hypothetical protein HWV62_26194 [Athelia sp. TMB]